eukprot:Transcript_31203.p4 GENE.Transcript_31203~~Transcript_31203.p4  ORF type:complete len:128 (-),score=35.25 Transcript_31203:4-387(-)
MRQAGWRALPRHATGLASGHYMYVLVDAKPEAAGEAAELPFFTRARDAATWWQAQPEKRKRRRQRCGACAACVRRDCGECAACADKPMFGGRGLKKQVCMLRRCHEPHALQPAELPPCPDPPDLLPL